MKGNKIKGFLAIVLFLLLFTIKISSIITAVTTQRTSGLYGTKVEKTIATGEGIVVGQCFQVSYRKFLKIPVGNEYYSMVYSSEHNELCLVRTKKGWHEENFTDDLENISEVTIKGLVKRVSGKFKPELTEYEQAYEADGIKLNTDYYVDLTYKSNAQL